VAHQLHYVKMKFRRNRFTGGVMSHAFPSRCPPAEPIRRLRHHSGSAITQVTTSSNRLRRTSSEASQGLFSSARAKLGPKVSAISSADGAGGCSRDPFGFGRMIKLRAFWEGRKQRYQKLQDIWVMGQCEMEPGVHRYNQWK